MDIALNPIAVVPSSDRIAPDDLRLMNKYPVLTEEDEHRLAIDFTQNNNVYAAQTLVYSNLRGVVYVARNYAGYSLPIMDLIQEGTIGLMKAVKDYNPLQGVRLFSWALPWIKSEIQQYVVRNWKIVKAATTDARKKLFFNVRKLKNQALPLNENIRAIATTLNIPEDEVREMDNYMTGTDATLDALEDMASAATPESDLEQAQTLRLSNQALQRMTELPEREAHIIHARFLQEPPATLADLAAHHSVSLERIRQLEKQALARMKTMLIAPVTPALRAT